MVWTVGNNAFEEPTSRSASRNSSQVTVPLQKVCVCAHNPIPLSGNAPYNQAGKMSEVTTSNQCSWYRKMWRISRITLHHLSTSFESVHQDIPLPDLSCSLLHDVCKSPETIFTNCHQHAQELALFSTLDICKTPLTISSWWLHSPLPAVPQRVPNL